MSGGYELTWHRDRENDCYRATDDRDGAVYVVARVAGGDRLWNLDVAVPGSGRPGQSRSRFDKLSTAQTAALATRCHKCFRIVPFADVEPSGSNNGWRCRDRADCAEAEAAREDDARRIHLEIRNTDLEEIGVNDTADGPELVFVRAGSRITVECTETDLGRLFRLLARRMRDRAMADIRDMIAQADAMLAAHDEQEERS